MRLQEIVGISTITIASLASGCNGPDVKQETKLQHAETAQQYTTLKGKIVGKTYTTKKEPWYFILQVDKEQQSFEIQFNDEKEYERIVRLLERDNHIEVDVNKNTYVAGTLEKVPSEKIRQGTQPETSHNPVLETVVERTLKTDKQEEQLPQNTIVEPVEGTVIGRTYYQFKENEQTYLFAIQTKYGIKTVETEIRDKIDEETLAVLVQPGKTVIIPVLTDKLEEKLYKVPVGRIGYLIKIAGDKKQNKR